MKSYGTEEGESREVFVPAVCFENQTEHEWHILLWQARGESDILVGDEHHRLKAGHAAWVPVRTRHSLRTERNSVVVPLPFDVKTTATTLKEPGIIRVDRDLRTLFLAFRQSMHPLVRPEANIGRQILSLIERNPVLVTALPMPSTRAALIVAETLRFNPGDDRSVEELATSAHASVSKIERAFRAETGMTLRQWRIENRMEAASILLRSTINLNAVAQRVGYTNLSAFGRVFKGHFGMTPSEYIRRFRTE
ncbi:MAG: helix-turn-helix domain-containing protein [Micrococcaceae bacterium]